MARARPSSRGVWLAIGVAIVGAACGGRSTLDSVNDSAVGTPSPSTTSTTPTSPPATCGACDRPASPCYAATGRCANGLCSYAFADGAACDDGNPCTSGDTCASGVCKGSTLCDAPPAPKCLSITTLRSYEPAGTCNEGGGCNYTHADTRCPFGCGDGKCSTVTVSEGVLSTCAVHSGALKCWGYNGYGDLGSSTFIGLNSALPIDVTGLTSGVANLSNTGGYEGCVLTTAGAVECWGWQAYGNMRGPWVVKGLPAIASVSAGDVWNCAVTTAGAVMCWLIGYPNGLNGGYPYWVPTVVPGLESGMASVSASGYAPCAVTTAGGVKCWGENGGGGATNTQDVVGLTLGVTAVATGAYSACALLVEGGVRCWGGNYYGVLGNSSGESSAVPVDVYGLSSGVVSITVGTFHACALTTAGGVKCWGYNRTGQLGNNTLINSNIPVDVVGLSSGVIAISAGTLTTCAVMASGGIKCWGDNEEGQLGNGTLTNSSVPIDVLGF
jgi:Regulator of chromosome condensation (RCC1) repeat